MAASTGSVYRGSGRAVYATRTRHLGRRAFAPVRRPRTAAAVGSVGRVVAPLPAAVIRSRALSAAAYELGR